MNKLRRLLAAALLTSCAGFGPEADDLPGHVSYPATELSSSELVELGMRRWTAATGLTRDDIPGGLVVFATSADVSCGSEPGVWFRACTITHEFGVSIVIRDDLGPELTEAVMVHEMGHALGIRGHLETGVVRSPAHPDHLIDAHTLEAVCELNDCVRFVPEN